MNLRTETENSGEDPDYAEFARPGESRNDPADMRRSSKAGSQPCCGEARNLR